MAVRAGVTRRQLLRAGGSSAAGMALLGAGAATARAQPRGGEDPPNAVLIVLPAVRADYVGVYENSTQRADTPNLDRLAKDSLRFEVAVPDAGPSLPARRSLVTGMRAFPFRDWRTTDGMPTHPGFCPIWDHQPVITEVTTAGGYETAWVTDNRLLEGNPRFEGVLRKPAGQLPDGSQEDRYMAPLNGARRPASQVDRVFRTAVGELDSLSRAQPFFLAVDPFDPREYSAPSQGYGLRSSLTVRRLLRKELDPVEFVDRDMVTIDADDDVKEEVRDLYADEVRTADRWVGRLLDRLDGLDLTGNTVVYVVGDGAVSLGENGIFGSVAGQHNRRLYQVPYMVRDPDGRRAGKVSEYFASTHDVAPTLLSYMGLTIPGKMRGEDLIGLLEHEDMPRRRWFTTAMDNTMVAGNRHWMLLADPKGTNRRLFEFDDEDDPDDIEPATREFPDVLDEMWNGLLLAAAGGTLPDFGPDGVIRPRPEDDDIDDDGVPDSEDPFDQRQIDQDEDAT